MSSTLIWNIAFLAGVARVLCDSSSIILQGENRSGSSLTDILRKKIDSARVFLDDEKTSKGDSFGRNRGQLGFDERKQDERRYDEQDTEQKGHDKGRHSLGESEAIDQGRNAFERHGSGYYKKGHHRTGFTNNYHKDESGNNSSFYEDSDDEGGHKSTGNNGVYYGQKSRDSFRDGARDAAYTGRDRGLQGLYDNRQNYHNYQDHTGGYHRDRFKDDRRNYLQDDAGHHFDRNGNKIYYRKENLYPTIRRNDYVLPFGNSHYDLGSRDYYTDDHYDVPYLGDHRYFPNHRAVYGRELHYPYKERYHKGFLDDFHGDEYKKKYRNDFDNGYYRF
ncbi:uncharacterized protein LOC143352265 [Halictus rubicundus]|uniref:uncharacterized protein LOC143352265 n=1 Tax=Halictus rubicundus TaxID=77578 RepID=UPI0040369A00